VLDIQDHKWTALMEQLEDTLANVSELTLEAVLGNTKSADAVQFAGCTVSMDSN
jgi:hypothetical protein